MKKYILLFCLLLVFPFLLVGCGKEEKISAYTIDIVYDDENHILSGEQEVFYVNNSNNAFTKLYFHLYPNAFREEAKESPVSVANKSKAYPNGESFGNIDIKSVKVAGREVNIEIGGEDENLLIVPLKEKLYPDENVTIFMDYVVKIPNVHHRFGYGENTINLANFYPIACVYEEGRGFMTDLYCANGDPFYSDMSNYSVTISYDKDFKIASSGSIVSSKQNDKTKVNIEAKKVRDFAFILSKNFDCKTQKINNTEVKYFYYNDLKAEESLKVCVQAFKFFSDKFGEYPYKQLSVVQSNFVYGGMEYPNMVLISDELNHDSSNYVIVHEIAHQWWYGVVGNDQYNESWVDESLTEYSTALFFENHREYGFDYKMLVTKANSSFKFYYDIYKSVCDEVDTSMARAVNEFDTEPEYIHSIYTQGVIMYDSLRELIGEKRFYTCCKKYFNKFAYKNASGADLINCFSRASGRNLESFFKSYLDGNVVIR